MRSTFGWIFVGLMACTTSGKVQDPAGPPETQPATPETAPVTAPVTAPITTPVTTPTTPETTPPANLPTVTVQMTAATLADDCGGPPPASKAKEKSVASMRKGDTAHGVMGKRACEQSSMQLSVVAGEGGGPTQLGVKKVELFDDKGALIGELTARMPSVWDANGVYQAWDQSVAPRQELSVSYALSQPPWDGVPNRRAQTYVLKAVITIGGGEQSVQREVSVAAPTILPPNVKT